MSNNLIRVLVIIAISLSTTSCAIHKKSFNYGDAIGGFISDVNPQKAPIGGQMLRSGGLGGAKNVGEKMAGYYLKQSESMVPVLTVPPGSRVQAQITRWFPCW